MEEEVSLPAPSENNTSRANPVVGAFSFLRDVAIAVVLAIVMIVFIYQPVKVEGTSMMPGLTDQERIFINKYIYRLGSGSIARLDLVVFNYPYDPSQSYIKRIVGLPGDTIEIKDGVVFVNGNKLDEPYVPTEYQDHRSFDKRLVPPGQEYYVLGDHRSSSNDSRIWGFVARNEIYGKAVFIYWPPNKIGRVH